MTDFFVIPFCVITGLGLGTLIVCTLFSMVDRIFHAVDRRTGRRTYKNT